MTSFNKEDVWSLSSPSLWSKKWAGLVENTFVSICSKTILWIFKSVFFSFGTLVPAPKTCLSKTDLVTLTTLNTAGDWNTNPPLCLKAVNLVHKGPTDSCEAWASVGSSNSSPLHVSQETFARSDQTMYPAMYYSMLSFSGCGLLMSLNRSMCSAKKAFWSEVSMTGSVIWFLLKKLTSPPTYVCESSKGVQFPVFDGSMLFIPRFFAVYIWTAEYLGCCSTYTCVWFYWTEAQFNLETFCMSGNIWIGLIPMSVSETQLLWWTACWIQVHELQIYFFHYKCCRFTTLFGRGGLCTSPMAMDKQLNRIAWNEIGW